MRASVDVRVCVCEDIVACGFVCLSLFVYDRVCLCLVVYVLGGGGACLCTCACVCLCSCICVWRCV